MATLQEIHKNVLWHGHEFESCLNRAIHVCKDAEDWEKLLTYVNKTEEILRDAKREIQKRHPPSRPPSIQVSGYTPSAGKPASTGSIASYSSSTGQKPSGSVAKPLDFSRSLVSQPYDKKELLSDKLVGPLIIRQGLTSPTRMNSKVKYQWFDDMGKTSGDLLNTEKQKLEMDLQRILIPNLPPFTTDGTLRTALGRYGKVVEVRTSVSPDGKGGEGIVRFESRDTVTQLLHKTLVLNGTEVKVKPFYSKSEKENKPQSGAKDNRTLEMLTETTKTRKVNSGEKQTSAFSATEGSNKNDTTDKCMICKLSRSNCVLLWCGHNVVCSACGGRLKNCPKCNQSIEKLSLI